jgi:hypothetical protein
MSCCHTDNLILALENPRIQCNDKTKIAGEQLDFLQKWFKFGRLSRVLGFVDYICFTIAPHSVSLFGSGKHLKAM